MRILFLALVAVAMMGQALTSPDQDWRQRGTFDLSVSRLTRPWRVALASPSGVCLSPWEAVYSYTSGAVHVCKPSSFGASEGTWEQVAGGGSGGTSFGLGTTGGAAALTVAAGSVRVGSVVTAFAGGTITSLTGSGTYTAYVGWDPATDQMVVALPSGWTGTCTGLSCRTGTAMDAGWVPVATCPVTGGNVVGTCTSLLSAASRDLLEAGNGISITQQAGGQQRIAWSGGYQQFFPAIAAASYGTGFAAGAVGPGVTTLGGSGHRH